MQTQFDLDIANLQSTYDSIDAHLRRYSELANQGRTAEAATAYQEVERLTQAAHVITKRLSGVT